MRIVRVDHDGPRYAELDEDGSTLRLLRGDPFGELDHSGETSTLAASPALVPVTPTKVLAVGRNYARHAEEMGLALGDNPSVFLKPLQTLLAHDGDVVLPPTDLSGHVEHEAELAVVIGRTARNVKAVDAFDHILGFTCADDVSARDLQRGDPQLTRGKGFDTFCPLGMFIETDVRDTDYEVTCHVNGEERQRASTAELIYPIPFLIEWLSAWTTLVPGDVVLTGSPAGTGHLRAGDRVEIAVSGVSSLRHGVVSA
ncbi:fumarylacetoacetate hydrolase family protein [Nocardioides sp. LHG3406-4]|uniref:fumarylacetoacetate hydrolase family protein n=1 Tax=Nocardioides sp. LHG3406-4 TaxID=2804575 RepID=UPI003CF85486